MADRERRLVSAYRTPDPATTIARLTRECERLRGELAAAKRPRGRWGWRDKLALPMILCGYPIGGPVIFAAHGGTVAYVVTYAVGFVWWTWASRYARSER